MERIRQEFNLTDKIEAAAEFYGYSSRRLYDQIGKGRVLGITYVPDHGVIFHTEGPYVMVGPLPGGRTTVLLPPGTVGINPFCSGLTSGFPLVTGLNLGRKHPQATIELTPCHSGKIVQVFYSRLDD
jgi:hypothetical protein